MDLLTDLRNTVLRPVLKREVDDQVRHGRKERAHNLADEYDIDKSYIEDKARERFNDILGYTTKDQAAYARDMGLDREWARDRANEWVEDYIEQAERGSLTRDRHVGHHMRVFDLTEDEIDGAEDLDFHVYAPDNTASEELADAILEYRARSAVDSFGDLDSPRYAYADAEEVRERIEERAEVAADEEFQSRLSEWRDDTASTDPYERLGMEWAATGDLEEYIDSFWEPDDEPDLISIDLET